METIFYILGGLLVVGAVFAIIEHLRKRTFFRHDLTQPGGQTHADQEGIRAEGAALDRISGQHIPHQ